MAPRCYNKLMALWGNQNGTLRPVVLVEIGSGSVGIAIMVSDPEKSEPEVVWSHREFALIRDIKATTETIKHLNTAMVNGFLELGSSGLKALKDYNPKLVIKEVQATVSAPWSYTATKTVTYTDENPFSVDDELIRELTLTAEKQAKASVAESGLEQFGLKIISNATIHIRINGYNVHTVSGQEGRSVELSHITSLATSSILKTLEESTNKVLPKAKINVFSFMYIYYCLLKNMHPDTSEICLVDITSEATEIGIVRDGVLKHVTHGPYGTFTLAREIAASCNIPKEEAYTYLKGGQSFVETKLSKAKQDQLMAIVSAYELKIATLFKATGDQLSIPKTVFLHTNNATENFFKIHIKSACKEATHGEHTVHVVTSKLLENIKAKDSSILLSASFVHQDLHCTLDENQ